MRTSKLLLSILVISTSRLFSTEISDKKYNKLIKEDPMNAIYPKSVIEAAVDYAKAADAMMKDGAIPEKYAELMALSVAAATKCQYCIPYHKLSAISAGATDEEIKTALSIAGNLMRMSTLLNGNEFDLEEFKEMLKELFPAQ